MTEIREAADAFQQRRLERRHGGQLGGQAQELGFAAGRIDQAVPFTEGITKHDIRGERDSLIHVITQ